MKSMNKIILKSKKSKLLRSKCTGNELCLYIIGLNSIGESVTRLKIEIKPKDRFLNQKLSSMIQNNTESNFFSKLLVYFLVHLFN